MSILKIAIWNANGLSQHKNELKTFLINQDIDIMLISETHFTNQNNFKIPGYLVYDTKHPDGKAHGGSAILIKKRLRHHELQQYKTEHIQASSICLEEWSGNYVVSAIYSPPKFSIKTPQYIEYFETLGERFLAGGDYNAKHVKWGSRLTTTKGKELYEAMQVKKLDHVSTGHPTYWPTDRKKIPDLLDFCVTKNIARSYIIAKDCYDLSSDHSPVIILMNSNALKSEPPKYLTNKKTNWGLYKNLVELNSHLNIPLQTNEEIESALVNLNKTLQDAAKESTPLMKLSELNKDIPKKIQHLLQEKRNLRREWQKSRSPIAKWKLNRSLKNLKQALIDDKNDSIETYLNELTATEATDYSLWKATKKLKQPTSSSPPIRLPNGNWARKDDEKAVAFANHLAEVFKPHEFPETNSNSELEVNLKTSKQIKFKWKEVKAIIKSSINLKKAPGYDMISGKMIKELPDKCIQLICYIFNAISRNGCFPRAWKTAQIIMIPKPGKDETQVTSYRPISLLPTLSKLYEKMLLIKLHPILEQGNIIPAHQFGFRNQHSTIEQVHRIVNVIKTALDRRKYCSAVFLDVAQAFDKVWHHGLIAKIKHLLPSQFHNILENYLLGRQFFVKFKGAETKLHNIEAGVPQGSVLGPVLYLLFTSDLPISDNSLTSTFADDTAIMVTNKNPQTASRELQEHLSQIEQWMTNWRIKANESKSVHVTFTLHKRTCPMVKFNNISIPQHKDVKYLGLHLDRRLTWKKHIETKRKQIKLKYSKLYWMIGKNSALTLDNKLLLYKSIIKPVWTYGIQLWGSTSASNRDIIQRVQSKILRSITGAPWYIRNRNIHLDLGMDTIDETIKAYSARYKTRLQEHPNELARNILFQTRYSRLKRTDPLDLMT